MLLLAVVGYCVCSYGSVVVVKLTELFEFEFEEEDDDDNNTNNTNNKVLSTSSPIPALARDNLPGGTNDMRVAELQPHIALLEQQNADPTLHTHSLQADTATLLLQRLDALQSQSQRLDARAQDLLAHNHVLSTRAQDLLAHNHVLYTRATHLQTHVDRLQAAASRVPLLQATVAELRARLSVLAREHEDELNVAQLLFQHRLAAKNARIAELGQCRWDVQREMAWLRYVVCESGKWAVWESEGFQREEEEGGWCEDVAGVEWGEEEEEEEEAGFVEVGPPNHTLNHPQSPTSNTQPPKSRTQPPPSATYLTSKTKARLALPAPRAPAHSTIVRGTAGTSRTHPVAIQRRAVPNSGPARVRWETGSRFSPARQ
ncbi:hypothetical protein SVAN01_02419 [Stagonosporopsis vannaccii]|nr:hypothetical protein SVAN01_02419 [Stagonosporopsis vannaccii]